MQKVEGLLSWKVDTDSPDKILHVEMEPDATESVVAAVQKAGFQIQAI